MPERIDAARAAFTLGAGSGDHVPSLVLAAGRDVPTMPALGAIRRPVAGWRLLARATLCVLDGPGDDGFLIGPLPQAQVDRQASWCEGVEQRGWAVVVLVADSALPERMAGRELAAIPGARGGMVRAVPPATR